MVRALILLLDHPDAVGEVYNVGSTEEISIVDLARRIIARTGSPSVIDYIPYSEAYGIGFEDMERRLPDTSKLQALTGWISTFSLDDTLAETIAEAALESVAATVAF